MPGWGICSRCQRLRQLRVCPQCGLPAALDTLPCGRCLQKPPVWQRLIAASDYAPPVSGLVHQFKFHGRTALAPALARLLLLKVLAAKRAGALPVADIIISVPLHRARAWRRGYNQSALLAMALSRWLGIRYAAGVVARIKAAAPQRQLSARQRRSNLKDAFRVELPVTGLHIVIVDDVVTTGSTVAQIARQLKRNGAATVQVWCLCRTL
ncbi:Competence protein F homolog,phosphoribosyltransferase domain; protein YhgH required for utilization of DNA as sole source of carbon and energy [Cronobacter condimenti 1330]|uniref:Competence protein F homolog,phosphoribosyltransferase domain protein YhgH required for utilization of DNA as sole source of carbon and energy n=1 Tax=Cronobacter condimenti 1330 TaxID=1073999 RepID=K8A0Y0_9ENTR|nr:Competence protein F homolog,phosphoribosyltransferase domain; protein YhgH required for utilization of DNA as sole source of carbon and energy [Cronobacter condimenti 1330]